MSPGNEPTTIEPGELHRRLQEHEDLLLLDVRTPEEFDGPSGHLEGALLIPVQELERRVGELSGAASRTIVAYCRSGNRSHHAMVFLTKRGFRSLNMVGGMLRWNEERLPVVHEHGE